MELRVTKISKKIRGKEVLSDVSLQLHSGKIYGFVGRNGSGKTMLFRAISGLMKVDQGEICLDQQVLHKDMDVLPRMGIVLENAGLYPEYTGKKNLEILGKYTGVSEADIEKAILRVGLDPKDKRTFRKYSLGMKQRIVIAQAIMGKPDILILDEPTNALDEAGVELVHRILLEEKERGAIVLLASHNRQDIELCADEIYSMEAGRLREMSENEELGKKA